MTDNDSALRRRFEELGDRAETRRCCIFSDFLNLHEQSVLQNMRLPHRFVLFGRTKVCLLRDNRRNTGAGKRAVRPAENRTRTAKICRYTHTSGFSRQYFGIGTAP